MLVILIIPFLVVSLIIMIDDGFPVIFKSERIGQNEKVFILYKFRSMKRSAPNNVATKNLNSNLYLTRIGRIIRRLSIDELPQLFNVLKGDMSFIGYRPLVTTELDIHELRKQKNIYNLKPGISGLAQVQKRDLADDHTKVYYDEEYLNKFSLWQDLKIVILTIIVIVFGHGYREG
jgi:O-antigen biosynthesis protein WbqP